VHVFSAVKVDIIFVWTLCRHFPSLVYRCGSRKRCVSTFIETNWIQFRAGVLWQHLLRNMDFTHRVALANALLRSLRRSPAREIPGFLVFLPRGGDYSPLSFTIAL
jgi:hypothetical protein